MSRRYRNRDGYGGMTNREYNLYQEWLAERQEAEERERERRINTNLRMAQRAEQKAALLRTTSPGVNPQFPELSLKRELALRTGEGSPEQFAQFAQNMSRARGVPLEEVNVAENYLQAIQEGTVNNFQYPPAIATGPIPSRRATKRILRGTPALEKLTQTTPYNASVSLQPAAARMYTNPNLRERLGLSRNVPYSARRRAAQPYPVPGSEWTTHEGGPAGGEGAAFGGKRRRKTQRRRSTRRSRR